MSWEKSLVYVALVPRIAISEPEPGHKGLSDKCGLDGGWVLLWDCNSLQFCIFLRKLPSLQRGTLVHLRHKARKGTAGSPPHAPVRVGLFTITFSAPGTGAYTELPPTPNADSGEAWLGAWWPRIRAYSCELVSHCQGSEPSACTGCKALTAPVALDHSGVGAWSLSWAGCFTSCHSSGWACLLPQRSAQVSPVRRQQRCGRGSFHGEGKGVRGMGKKQKTSSRVFCGDFWKCGWKSAQVLLHSASRFISLSLYPLPSSLSLAILNTSHHMFVPLYILSTNQNVPSLLVLLDPFLP